VSWFSAVPVIATAVAIMFVPGLLVNYLFGLRGIAAWAIAPVIPISVASVGAIIAPMLGVRLSIWVLVVPSVLIAVVIGLLAFLLRRRLPARAPDERGMTFAILAGLGVALVVGVITATLSITDADNYSATFDAVFHYHALSYIEDTGNGSALTIASLGVPDIKAAFYPAAWHDLTAILQNVTGASIPEAANVITVVIALLVWPLGCMLLARQLFGPSRITVGVAGALSVAFPAFPWTLMGYGTLWPNVLGLALIPAGLAVLMSITSLAKEDVIGRARAWVILPVLGLAALMAHPNSVFSLAVLAVPILGTWLFIWTRRQHQAGKTVRGLVFAALMLVGAFVFVYVVNELPMVNAIKATRWPPFESVPQAVGEVLLNSTNRKAAAWLLSIVVLAGIISCIRQKTRRWLIAGHVLSGALFMMAAAINTDRTALFTGFWYNDSWRLAAMLPITGVPLATIGVMAIATAVRNVLTKQTVVRLPSFARSPIAIVAVVIVAFGGLSSGFYTEDKAAFIEESYAQMDGGGNQKILTKSKLALIEDTERIVPPDALIAANPWIGATAVWSLADRRLLIPNLDPLIMTPDQAYLAKNLIKASTDPKVCDLVTKLNVQYLMTGPIALADGPNDSRLPFFSGLREPNGAKGFERVAQEGGSELFKITACGSGRS
jgi:hypothetical protein